MRAWHGIVLGILIGYAIGFMWPGVGNKVKSAVSGATGA